MPYVANADATYVLRLSSCTAGRLWMATVVKQFSWTYVKLSNVPPQKGNEVNKGVPVKLRLNNTPDEEVKVRIRYKLIKDGS